MAKSIAAVTISSADVATNLTAVVSGLTRFVANGGRSLTEKAWSEVDLLNLSAARGAGRLSLDDPRVLAGYLRSEEGRSL